MNEARPAYKSHALWRDAMDLLARVYPLAERLALEDRARARTLRKVAVAVPSAIAAALDGEETGRRDEAIRAQGALAEIDRQISMLPEPLTELAAPILEQLHELEGRVRTEFHLEN